MMSSDSESENEETMAWRKLKTHEIFDGKLNKYKFLSFHNLVQFFQQNRKSLVTTITN